MNGFFFSKKIIFNIYLYMAKKVKTDLNLDNNKITNLGNPTDQLDATNKDFIDELFIDLLNIGTWTYNNTLTAPPAINTFRMNNINHSLVTNIWINYTDLNSFVADFIFNRLVANDEIVIQDTLDSSKWVKYKITSKTDNTTYFTFVVTYVETSTSGSIISGNSCKLKFIENPTSTGGTVTTYNGTAVLDFGNDFISRTYTSTVVSDSNVSSGCIITLSIIPSTDHPYPEESIMEGLIIKADNLVNGVGFTIYATSINGSQGQYNIYYKIIN